MSETSKSDYIRRLREWCLLVLDYAEEYQGGESMGSKMSRAILLKPSENEDEELTQLLYERSDFREIAKDLPLKHQNELDVRLRAALGVGLDWED